MPSSRLTANSVVTARARLALSAVRMQAAAARRAQQRLLAFVQRRAAADAARDLRLSAGMGVEADAVLELFETDDAAEGIAAFLEKRRAEFRPRRR